MNIVQENMERIIDEKGLTKTGVAKRAGLTLLAGRKIIKAAMVPALCAALGVEPNDLYKKAAEAEV